MTALAAAMVNQGLNGTETRCVGYDTCSNQLIGYRTAQQARATPECAGGLFDYVFAGNGVFVHANRPELEVCFQVQQNDIRGLPRLSQVFDFRLPKVPEDITQPLIWNAMRWAEEKKESLYHLCHSELALDDSGWVRYDPEQERTLNNCRPLADGGSHERAIIEIHSHHSMAAKFSETDDHDETGFRLYGVIGRLPGRPEIRLRVGVYGYFWEIPANWVMELPDGLRDVNAE